MTQGVSIACIWIAIDNVKMRAVYINFIWIGATAVFVMAWPQDMPTYHKNV